MPRADPVTMAVFLAAAVVPEAARKERAMELLGACRLAETMGCKVRKALLKDILILRWIRNQ